MGIVSVTVQIGYESHTAELTEAEWTAVKRGKALTKDVKSYYEGGTSTYSFSFNGGGGDTLCVYYSTDEDFLTMAYPDLNLDHKKPLDLEGASPFASLLGVPSFSAYSL